MTTDTQREAFEKVCVDFKEQHSWFSWPKVMPDLHIADYFYKAGQAALSQQPVGEEELVKALKSARGTLEYLRVQSIEEHAGFSNVVFLNAKQAVVNIDRILARFNISDRGK